MMNFDSYLVSEIKTASTLPLNYPPPYSNKGLGQFNKFKKKGFTLAETLITLTIIGVIAALTVPTLMSKYRKHEVETKVKEAYSILSNAVSMSIANNGPLTEWEYTLPKEEFASKYIEPYIKFTEKTNHITYIAGVSYYIDALNSLPAGYYYYRTGSKMWYKLANGMILTVHTEPTAYSHAQNTTFIVDINGKKGPNRAGIDAFTFYITKETIPQFGTKHASFNDTSYCTSNDYRELNGALCARVIQLNGWKIPDNYPVKF